MIRIYFLFFALLCYSIGNSQKIEATANFYKWAGGMCCRQGTNYSVELVVSKKTMKTIEFNSICIDGKEFYSSDFRIVKQPKGKPKSIFIYFSFSFDDKEDPSNKNKNIESQDKLPPACDKIGVNYTVKNKSYFILFKSITQGKFQAYP